MPGCAGKAVLRQDGAAINLENWVRSLAVTLTPGAWPGFICLQSDSDCVSVPSGNMSALRTAIRQNCLWC